jgi:site-specific DNA recombinase
MLLLPQPVVAPVIYARISQTDTLKGVQRQIKGLMREAEEMGLPTPEVFMDNDLSSKEGVERPKFNEMWNLIRAGLRDCIMVYKMDRYSRENHHYDLIKKYKPVIITSGRKVYNPDDSEDMHALRGEAASAERETKRLSERLKEQRYDDAHAGLRHGAPAFGWGYRSKKGKWKNRNKANPEEKKELLAAMDRVIKGESLSAITHDWNARGVKTSRGCQWTTASVKSVLTRWSNAGVRQYQGNPLFDVKVEWEPLCDLLTLRQVQMLLGNNPRQTTTSRARRHLLTGVLMCACGTQMKAQHIGSSSRMVREMAQQYPEKIPTHYKCEGTGCGRSVPYLAADEVVEKWLVEFLRWKGADAFLPPDAQKMVQDFTAQLEELAVQRTTIMGYKLSAADKGRLLQDVASQEESLWTILNALATQSALSRLVGGLLTPQNHTTNTVSLEAAVERDREILARFRTLDLKTRKELLRDLATFTVHGGFSEPDPVSGKRRKLPAKDRIEIVPV